MQKQKVTNLTLQSTYDQIEIALFRGGENLDFANISKFEASALLIPTINNLLVGNSIVLNQLDFICASLGPAPFTTLRTTITTINGFGFAKKIPLVGVNSITNMVNNFETDCKNVVGILNAYSKSLYYAVKQNNKTTFGWMPTEQLFSKIQTDFKAEQVQIIGQGTETFKNDLGNLPQNFSVTKNGPKYSDINWIAKEGLELFEKEEFSYSLQPLYLKRAI